MATLKRNITKFIILDDLVLELSYEFNKFSIYDPPRGPKIYISNLHHGHSKTRTYWGDLIKSKNKPESEKGAGLKLLVWAVKNIDTIFPEFPPVAFWTGNFNPGYMFWSRTSFWSILIDESYVSNEKINEWANSEPTLSEENISKIKIQDEFSGGRRSKKYKRLKKYKRSKKI